MQEAYSAVPARSAWSANQPPLSLVGATHALRVQSGCSAPGLSSARTALRPGRMVSPPRGSPHGTLLFCGPRADFAGRMNWDAWLTARGCPRTSFPPAGSDRAGCWILRVGVGRGARSSTCGSKVVHRCPALSAVTLRRCRPRYAETCHRPRSWLYRWLYEWM